MCVCVCERERQRRRQRQKHVIIYEGIQVGGNKSSWLNQGSEYPDCLPSCWGVTPTSQNAVSWVWRNIVEYTPSLQLLPVPLCLELLVPVRILCIGQIDPFRNHMNLIETSEKENLLRNNYTNM